MGKSYSCPYFTKNRKKYDCYFDNKDKSREFVLFFEKNEKKLKKTLHKYKELCYSQCMESR